jgi:hypothetical protein
MVYLFWGPLKDPNVWAPPAYTLQAYLHDAVRGILYNLGIGGAAIVIIALAMSLASRVKDRLLLWIPSVGFVIIIVLISGYMPHYFLSPFNVAVALPVAATLAFVGKKWSSKASPSAQGLLVSLVAALCLINLWTANIAWVSVYFSSSSLVEDYCLRNLNRRELIHTANFWIRQEGAERLSYLGFNIDDRPLGALMARPELMPDVILIPERQAVWLEQFKQRPARDAMLAESGFNYRDFPGFQALGYRMVHTWEPQFPRLLDHPWIRSLYAERSSRIFVYRKLVQ